MIIIMLLTANAVLFLAQGLLVFLRSREKFQKISFLLFSLAGAAWALGIALFLSSNDTSPLTESYVVAYYVAAIVIAYSMLMLAISFSGIKEETMKRSAIILSVPTIILTILLIVNPNVMISNINIGEPNAVDLNMTFYSLFGIYFTVYAISSISVLFWAVKNAPSTMMRNRRMYVLLDYCVALPIGTFFNLVLPWIGNYTLIWVGPLAISLFVLILYFAMMRYRLFGISILVAKSVLLFTIAVVIAFFYSLVSTNILIPDYDVSTSFLFAQTMGALIFLGVTYLLMRVSSRSSSRWLERGLLNEELIDRVFHAALVSVNTEEVLKSIERIISDHISDGYSVTAVTEVGVEPVIAGSFKGGVSSKDIVEIERIMNSRQINTIVTEEIPTDVKDYDFLREHKVSAVVRVCPSDNRRSGLSDAAATAYLVICRHKPTLYSDRELSVLVAVCNIMSLTLENTLYYDKIQNFNQELEERVNEATASLRSANRKLKKLYKAEDDFIAMASHQLRTPLTSIRGYLSMLLEGDFGKVTDEQRHVLSDVYTSSERMVFLISDFLDVSRLQTGKFELQRAPMRLDEILTPEIQQMQIPAELRQIKIDYTAPTDIPLINGDRDKLRQVMINMIDNAIFYSHAGGHATISLHKRAGQVIFTVRDTGIGVPRVEQPKLFTKFFRASNARNIRPDGTGAGLFMVRKVIIAHGGSLIFESKEGEGSTFGFRLPIISESVS